MDELSRCVDFLRSHAFTVSDTGPSARFATALLMRELPRVWSLNFVVAERELATVSAEELAAEADELLGGAGLRHRKVEVWDEEAGERLADGFRELGWYVERDVVMVYRGPPDREVDTSEVRIVGAKELGPIWAEGTSADFKSDPEVVRQLVEYKRVLAERARARFFAAPADGRLASYCDLYPDASGTAQIEAVVTLEPYRGRGLARAVVTRAREAAEAEGHDLTFLLADDSDWPKHLYEKLGFVTVGAVYDFLRRPASPH